MSTDTLGVSHGASGLIKVVETSARGGPVEPASPSPATVTHKQLSSHTRYDYLQVREVTDGFILRAQNHNFVTVIETENKNL